MSKKIQMSKKSQPTYHTSENRRSNHNELERARRNVIKDSFQSLAGSVPRLKGKKTCRARTLQESIKYLSTGKDLKDKKKRLEKENAEMIKQIERLMIEQGLEADILNSQSTTNLPSTDTTFSPLTPPNSHEIESDWEDVDDDYDEEDEDDE